jgi:GT2 family glycosyltransferase
MDATALVINYNAGPLLCDCVQSLLDNGIEIIRVADNASSDGSFDALRARYAGAPGVHMAANGENRGFGPAINADLPAIDTRYLLIINPDCRLEAGAMAPLVAALDADETAAMAGPLVLDSTGQVEAAANRHFPTPWRALMTFSGLASLGGRYPALSGVTVPGVSTTTTATVPAEATSGACMLLRTRVLRELGGFDEGYALHCEDLDLMYRLRLAGHGVLFVPAARAVHAQGVSSATRPLWVHRQKHRGMARFFNRHLASRYAWPVVALVRLGIWLRWALTWPLVALRR